MLFLCRYIFPMVQHVCVLIIPITPIPYIQNIHFIWIYLVVSKEHKFSYCGHLKTLKIHTNFQTLLRLSHNPSLYKHKLHWIHIQLLSLPRFHLIADENQHESNDRQ